LLPVLPGGCSWSCVLEEQQVVVFRHSTAKPRRAGTPRTAKKDGEARRRNFPLWQRRKK
jgi:hypothetical protein